MKLVELWDVGGGEGGFSFSLGDDDYQERVGVSSPILEVATVEKEMEPFMPILELVATNEEIEPPAPV